jgi:hypothetical protein
MITHILLLFMNMANLEPNILFRKGMRRRIDDVLEALFARPLG